MAGFVRSEEALPRRSPWERGLAGIGAARDTGVAVGHGPLIAGGADSRGGPDQSATAVNPSLGNLYRGQGALQLPYLQGHF